MKNFAIGKKLDESAAILIDAILFWKEFEPEIETSNEIPVVVVKKRKLDNTYMTGHDLFHLFKRIFIDWYIKSRFNYLEIEKIGVEEFNKKCNDWWTELNKQIIVDNVDNCIKIRKY